MPDTEPTQSAVATDALAQAVFGAAVAPAPLVEGARDAGTAGQFLERKKSPRHSKITGDFGEHLILYWLSKCGFECARVDHTGIDLIARNPDSSANELMGISVKCRSRNPGEASGDVRIPVDDFKKAREACVAFGCVPYFAIVIDAGDQMRAWLLPLDRLIELSPPGTSTCYWKTGAKHKAAMEDAAVRSFTMQIAEEKGFPK